MTHTLTCARHPDTGKLALPGFTVCEPCMREGRHALADIERIAVTLWSDPEALLPHRGSDSGRGSTGYRSASPANDLVIALTDWRSVAEHPGDPEDFEHVVFGWAEHVRDLLGICYPRPRLDQWPSVMILQAHWTWICKRDWAGDCISQLLSIAAVLREVGHENRGRAKLGRCPVRIDGWRCRCLLLVRLDADHITCPRCDTRWARPQWRQLAEEIEYYDELERS